MFTNIPDFISSGSTRSLGHKDVSYDPSLLASCLGTTIVQKRRTMIWTREEEIADINQLRPHLVIVGAGASRAAFPDGDAHGRRLPLMNDLIQLLDLAAPFREAGIEWKSQNFEDLYQRIAEDPNLSDLKLTVETTIDEYFSLLELPEAPTLYDYLLLSLRGKDVIATFNWDPFLIRAYIRNYGRVPSLPKMLFLHGNVASGYCVEDNVQGVRDSFCPYCGKPFQPTRLLYPIGDKNYTEDREIEATWKDIQRIMKAALFVTIFGYGAPSSDEAAINLLATAWGNPENRQLEQIEVIDIREGEEIRALWSRFIHTHHYETFTNFSKNWIANHPRRTIEAYYAQYIDAKFIDENPLPLNADSLEEVWAWFEELSSHEAEM